MSPVLKPVLLVEDNLRDVELTLAVLARSGLANPVVVARDGVEALSYLFPRSSPDLAAAPLIQPAVVLLDLKMPRIDGIEVLERVKADPSTQKVPVVMLTASREPQDQMRSRELGVNAFIVKPVDLDDFFVVLHDLRTLWAVLDKVPKKH